MSEHYVLDACALIAFLNDEAGADVVEELLRKSNRQEPNLFLHRLNLLEVYYGIYREVGRRYVNRHWKKYGQYLLPNHCDVSVK